MDLTEEEVIEIINFGVEVESIELSGFVYRTTYSHEGTEIHVIEKTRSSNVSHIDNQANMLFYWKEKGFNIPEIVLTSTDHRLINYKPDKLKHLILSDLTEGNKYPIIDLWADEKKTKHLTRLSTNSIAGLSNSKELLIEIGENFAFLDHDGLKPRADYFMIPVIKKTGRLYMVDVHYIRKKYHKNEMGPRGEPAILYPQSMSSHLCDIIREAYIRKKDEIKSNSG